MAGGQSEGGGPALAALRGHGGCGTAGGSSALAAVRRPRWTAGRLVLTLLPWLRPAGSRSPLPQHPALGARRQRGPQRALVGSLPGHAKAGARWVTPGGQCAGGRQSSGAQQTARAPSPTFLGAAYWKCPVGLARVPKHDGVLGRLHRVGTRCLCTAPRLPGRAEVLFSGCRSLKCLEQPPRTRPWVLLLGPVFGQRRWKPQTLVLRWLLITVCGQRLNERCSPTARCKATPAGHCRHFLACRWRSTAL